MDDDETEEETVHAADMAYLDEPEEVEDVMDDRPMKVQEGLYIGSCMAEMNKNRLLRVGITDILQVAQGLYPHHPLIFNYMNVQVQDIPSEDLVRFFPNCFQFIDRAISKGGAVLVHCAAGVSRSATVVLGYLMSRYKMDLAAAVDHLKAIRPWVQPNTGFIQQLEAYQGLSHDMNRWRAWQLVWMEQQQQHGVQQQQHWLQTPQVHSKQQHQQGSSNDTNGSSASAAAVLQQRHGSSLSQPCNNGSSSSNEIGGIDIQCSACGPTSAAVHHCAVSCFNCCCSSRSDHQYSNSAPVSGTLSTASAARAAACAPTAAGSVMICDAPAAVPAAAANMVAQDSSSMMPGGSSRADLSWSCIGTSSGSTADQSQQQQQRGELWQAQQQQRHVGFADGCVAAAAGVASATAPASYAPDVDTEMADAADLYEI